MSTDRGQIRLHQCLFGYDDGHRLLESSIERSGPDVLFLLKLSDLEPGLTIQDAQGYWTGIPVPDGGHYALMRTWAAPEMPRPGCVWTHAILIPKTDLSRLPDLRVLWDLFVRPKDPNAHGPYSGAIDLKVTGVAPRPEAATATPARAAELMLAAIRSTYTNREPLFSAPGESDDTVFRVWSQQWPKLRRSFSFRTAGQNRAKGERSRRFHLRVARWGGDYLHPPRFEMDANPQKWEKVVVQDALAQHPTGLRKFLWRYGSDLDRGIDRFEFLARLFTSLAGASPREDQVAMILGSTAQELVDTRDGGVLKKDLIAGGRTKYSLVPMLDPLAILQFAIESEGSSVFPPIPLETLSEAVALWPDRSEDLLSLAQESIEKSSYLSGQLVALLSARVEPGRALASTIGKLDLRRALVEADQSLLVDEALLELPVPELLYLLALLSPDDPANDAILRLLVGRQEDQVAARVANQLPSTILRVLGAAIQESDDAWGGLPEAWRRMVSARADAYLHGYVQRARSTTVLSNYADLFGVGNPDVEAAGPGPWVAALGSATDDVTGARKTRLQAFLLVLALARPAVGCEVMFEYGFDALHQQLVSSRLAKRTQGVLLPYLPYVGWWRERDLAGRLRAAVVDAYAANRLDQDSFRRLTRRKGLASDLAKLADERGAGGVPTRRGKAQGGPPEPPGTL